MAGSAGMSDEADLGESGGVCTSSTSGSSGITDEAPETVAVDTPVDTPDVSSVSLSFRRLTTRCLRFRWGCMRERLDRPAWVDGWDARLGRVDWVSLPVLPDAIDDECDFEFPKVDWMRDKLETVSGGVLAPDSCRSRFALAR